MNIDNPTTLDAAIDRIANLKRFIDTLRDQHRRDLAEEIERTHAAEFDAEVSCWAVRGLVGFQVKLTLADSTVMKAQEGINIVEELGKNAAYHFLRAATERFSSEAEHVRARQHIHYLENHAQSRGLQFTPFGER